MKINSKHLMIGGQALVHSGSDRHTKDMDYLVNDVSSTDPFMHDMAANVAYVNANGHPFFAEVWEMEQNNIGPLASPQALLELKAFSYVQHCLNKHWRKADADEYDIKFLVRNFHLSGVKLVNKYIKADELSEVEKVIKSAKR